MFMCEPSWNEYGLDAIAAKLRGNGLVAAQVALTATITDHKELARILAAFTSAAPAEDA